MQNKYKRINVNKDSKQAIKEKTKEQQNIFFVLHLFLRLINFMQRKCKQNNAVSIQINIQSKKQKKEKQNILILFFVCFTLIL